MRLLLLASSALLLTACGSSATSATPPVTVTVPAAVTPSAAPTASAIASTPAMPGNPVTILHRVAGCVLEAGTTSGSVDINGNRYASCTLHPGQPRQADVTVRTFPAAPTGGPFYSNDTTRIVVGPTFIVMVTPAMGETITPAALSYLAHDVGGTVAPAQP